MAQQVKVGDVNGIPIISLAAFLNASNKQAVAEAMLDSFKTIGFVYLVDHGVPKEKIDGMFDWSKKFFALPAETKMLAPHPPSGTHHRGYSPPGKEKVVQHIYDEKELAKIRAKAPDAKESFEVGREEDAAMTNIWLPDGVFPGFKEACLDFFWVCREVELTILRALSLGLHLEEGFLEKFHTAPDNQLRLLHYPSVRVDDLERDEIARIGAHSDFGSITLLMQDNVGGLEVENPHKPGEFTPATPVEGAIVVNAGDFLMRWSNDMIKSTIHRVRAPPNASKEGMTPERYSIPYFCSADYSRTVDCLPGTFTEKNPKKYDPISSGQYIMSRLAATY
ncbi:Clavaminate synthase-like protein [Rhodofomes roseus]|uniref:Clavaminate synthase-like protein n=1 Tax=Rhodofomes roseus TaxID=34475 RepID=A0ABQ8KRW6_9APHY|nr:Clavaminate synthase-like protein [Rhodofomes roseus]KAH9841554.1 Clavaminate synthase-like protein [Rhodofomes roseus]